MGIKDDGEKGGGEKSWSKRKKTGGEKRWWGNKLLWKKMVGKKVFGRGKKMVGKK